MVRETYTLPLGSHSKPDVVVCTYAPRTWDPEAEGLRFLIQSELDSEMLFLTSK